MKTYNEIAVLKCAALAQHLETPFFQDPETETFYLGNPKEDPEQWEKMEDYNVTNIYDIRFIVYTDEEAVEAADDAIKESLWAFNADFICRHANLPPEAEDMISDYCEKYCESANETIQALIENGDGLEDFIEDAVRIDGRGHFLGQYDGRENKEVLQYLEDGTEKEMSFYIYKTN